MRSNVNATKVVTSVLVINFQAGTRFQCLRALKVRPQCSVTRVTAFDTSLEALIPSLEGLEALKMSARTHGLNLEPSLTLGGFVEVTT